VNQLAEVLLYGKIVTFGEHVEVDESDILDALNQDIDNEKRSEHSYFFKKQKEILNYWTPYMEEKVQWKMTKAKVNNEIELHYNTDQVKTQGMIVKCRTELEGDPEAILQFLKSVEFDLDQKAGIQKSISPCKREVVKKFNDNFQFVHVKMNTPFPFQKRELLLLHFWEYLPDDRYGVICSQSIEHESVLPEKGSIRVIGGGYWRVKPLDNGKVELISFFKADLGGNFTKAPKKMFKKNSHQACG